VEPPLIYQPGFFLYFGVDISGDSSPFSWQFRTFRWRFVDGNHSHCPSIVQAVVSMLRTMQGPLGPAWASLACRACRVPVSGHFADSVILYLESTWFLESDSTPQPTTSNNQCFLGIWRIFYWGFHEFWLWWHLAEDRLVAPWHVTTIVATSIVATSAKCRLFPTAKWQRMLDGLDLGGSTLEFSRCAEQIYPLVN